MIRCFHNISTDMEWHYDGIRNTTMDSYGKPMKASPLIHLPSIAIGNILSLLSWREKLSAVAAIKEWRDELQSPQAWDCFENCHDEVFLCVNSHMYSVSKEEIECIKKYGKYFQNCKLNYFCIYKFDCSIDLLKTIAFNCPNLKSVTLEHPDGFRFSQLQDLVSYTACLQLMCLNCVRSIRLFNLDYLPLNEGNGVEEIFSFLSFYHDEVLEKIDMLEFSHTRDFGRPLQSITSLCNLTHLKAPIQTLNTSMIKYLSKLNLKKLFLVSDGSTMNEGFQEQKEIVWDDIAKVNHHLIVHYIFQERTIYSKDLVPNPLVRCLVFDSLCNSLSRDVLQTISALYGNSLETFAHLATKWIHLLAYEDMESLPCDFYHFATQCIHLKTFAIKVAVPCEAVWCLAVQGRLLKKLFVSREQLLYNYHVCLPFRTISHQELDPSFLKHEVSEWLGYPWEPLSDDQMAVKTRYLTKFSNQNNFLAFSY